MFKKYRLFLVVSSLLVMLLLLSVLGYSVAGAKTAKPQDQVKNFMTNAAGLKVSKAIVYWVPEKADEVKAAMNAVPAKAKISLSKAKYKLVSQDVTTAVVGATYNIKIKVKGQANVVRNGEEAKFTLSLVNNKWLIADSDILYKQLWNVSVSTPTPMPTTTTLAPVKIGAINSWSGPAALSGLLYADPIIQLVEKQVKDQGGILGGRDVKVVRFDNHGSVSDAAAGVATLVNDEKVSAITMGGGNTDEIEAVADAAEVKKVLFVAVMFDSTATAKPEQHQFTVSATVQGKDTDVTIDLLNKVLKPKTMAILSDDGENIHVDYVKAAVEAAGTKTVYEQYISLTTMDFTPYLTQIKADKPDVLYVYFTTSERIVTLAKGIINLGGLGDTKVVTLPSADSAKGLPGAQGWYMWTTWIQEMDNPGSVKFENDYQAMFGKLPTANHVYFYNSLWTAIYAIKLAGTDTDLVKIAQATRSGNLEWDTPIGRAHYTADGNSGLRPIMTQIVDKNLVLVNIPK